MLRRLTSCQPRLRRRTEAVNSDAVSVSRARPLLIANNPATTAAIRGLCRPGQSRPEPQRGAGRREQQPASDDRTGLHKPQDAPEWDDPRLPEPPPPRYEHGAASDTGCPGGQRGASLITRLG